MPASTDRSNPPQPSPRTREDDLEDAILELEVIVTCAALA